MTPETWVSFYIWIGIVGGVLVVVGSVGAWHHGNEVSRMKDRQIASLESSLQSKSAELAKASAEAKALATRDVFRPLVGDARANTVSALRALMSQASAPVSVVVHHYNTLTPGMTELYGEIGRVFDEAGVPHRIGNEVGMNAVMPLPPPLVIGCAPGDEAAATRLSEALGKYLRGQAAIEANPRLRPRVYEVSLFRRPEFNEDGTISLR
jgi:hypothetical protein